MNWHEKNLAGKVLLKCIMEKNQILLLKLHIILIKHHLNAYFKRTYKYKYLAKQIQKIKKIRSEAAENAKQLDKRMVDKHKKRHKTMEHKYNNKALIPIANSGKRSHPKRRFAVERTILKKGKHSDNYKVLLIPPSQTNFTEQWVSIEDIALAKHTNKTNSCRKSHRST